MLDPEYLLHVSEGGEAIAETLHNDIIKKIIERIALRLDRGDNYILTAQDKWQIEVLQEAGYLREDIEKILAQKTGLMQKEIAEAMEEAGVKALDYDHKVYEAAGLSPTPLMQSPYLIRLMQRAFEATVGEWVNFTRTTADVCQQAFIQACDKAYTQVSSGAVGYGQAYVDAINDIVSDGVVVTYPSRHTDTIETATLRCIRTGVSQSTGQITDARMDEMGWDIILVSSHLGARVTDKEDFTNHYWWQGKFYSKSGRDPRFPPFSVCRMGHVQGIHGANCRHSHGPGDGEFNPYKHYDSEENKKEFELQQRQRTMERRIRESERKCMGMKEAVDNAGTSEGKALAQKEYEKRAALLQKRNKAYNDFCEESNLKKLNERITIAKWDRDQAKNARIAANRARKRNEIATPGSWGEKAVPYTERGIEIDDRVKEYIELMRNGGDYIQRPAGEIQYQDLAILTTESGVEHSMITIGDASYLIRGEEKKTTIPKHLVDNMLRNRGTLDCHSHPYIGDLIPSEADKKFLEMLTWQEESVIIDPVQNAVKFTAAGFVEPVDIRTVRQDDYYQFLFGGGDD